MKKSYFFTLTFFVFSSFLFSQSNSAEPSAKKKEHYRIINNGSDSPLNLEKLLPGASLDSLRFLNERRQIAVEGTSLVVELFSAQELLNDYKKPVSQLTINDPAKARKVKIRLVRNKGLEIVGQ
jgi:hypothetical protein